MGQEFSLCSSRSWNSRGGIGTGDYFCDRTLLHLSRHILGHLKGLAMSVKG